MTAGLIGHYDPARAAGAGHGVATVTVAGLLPCQVKLGGQLVYLLDELWDGRKKEDLDSIQISKQLKINKKV